MSTSPRLTVIVPTYNVEDRLEPLIDGLGALDALLRLEVLFVDDCSSDGTRERLAEVCVSSRGRWRVLCTEENSGAPSRPRNIGLEHASGDWVFFLDGDDAPQAQALVGALEAGERLGAAIVRGPVQVQYTGRAPFTVDRMPGKSGEARVTSAEEVARLQSLTCSALYRREFLSGLSARFDESVHMGEDLAFTAEVLCAADVIAYFDRPLFLYIKAPASASSAMHSMGNREASELAWAWGVAESAYSRRGESYVRLHGLQTISFALRQFIRHSSEPLKSEAFESLSAFFVAHAEKIRELRFDERVAPLVKALVECDFEGFRREVKPRLLIAGHDLKFIRRAIPVLSERFSVLVDEWESERVHDPARSVECAEWADMVWCEWLTACAVWYSHNLSAETRLVTRLHRYELGRDYGLDLNLDRTDAVITIAPHCFEDAIARFGFSRGLVRYIPNYYDSQGYVETDGDPERRFRLALIGIAPRRKGYLRALELLRQLRERDARYSLTVMGSDPLDYPWIASDPSEAAYYQACERFIDDHALSSSVKMLGWVDTTDVVGQFGTVLSMSDGEGCHIGPGEAFLAGNAAEVLRWRGAEYIYPAEFVHESVQEMAQVIADNNLDPARLSVGRAHFSSAFSLEAFEKRVWELWRDIAG